MKKALVGEDASALVSIAKYIVVAIVVVTIAALLFGNEEAYVAIPVSFALMLLGLFLGNWAHKKQ